MRWTGHVTLIRHIWWREKLLPLDFCDIPLYFYLYIDMFIEPPHDSVKTFLLRYLGFAKFMTRLLGWQCFGPVTAPGLRSRVPPSAKLQHCEVLRFHDGWFRSDLFCQHPPLLIPVVVLFYLFCVHGIFFFFPWETEALCLSACVLMSVSLDLRLCLTNPLPRMLLCYSGLPRPAARWIWSWMSTFSPPHTVHPVIFTHTLSPSAYHSVSFSFSLSFARACLDLSAFGTHKQWSGPGRDSKALLCTHGCISLGTLTR